MNKKYPLGKKALISFVIFLPVFLHACASTPPAPDFSSVPLKNSLPLIEKNLIEEVHVVSVTPFYNDSHRWKEAVNGILSSSPAISVVSPEEVNAAVRETRRDLSALSPEERPEFLSMLGKATRSDAVLNGLILTHEKQLEIILQLVSAKDSRILWWQAADFRYKGGSLSLSEQKTLLTQMLGSLLPHLGKRKKPVIMPFQVKPQPSVKEQSSDAVPKTETPQKPEPKKTDKKPKKGKKPRNVSPM